MQTHRRSICISPLVLDSHARVFLVPPSTAYLVHFYDMNVPEPYSSLATESHDHAMLGFIPLGKIVGGKWVFGSFCECVCIKNKTIGPVGQNAQLAFAFHYFESPVILKMGWRSNCDMDQKDSEASPFDLNMNVVTALDSKK